MNLNKSFSRANTCILQFIKYLLASVIALGADYCVYLLLLDHTILSVPYAAIAGYAFGIFVSYYFIKFKVFGNGWLSSKPSWEFTLFCFSGVLGLLVTYIATTFVVHYFGPRPQLAKLVAVFLSFFAVFFFRKLVVFRSPTITEA